MKKVISLILIVILIGGISAVASETKVQNYENFIIEETIDSVTIKGLKDKTITNLFLPAIINGKDVVLDNYLFKEYENLKHVIFENGVKVVPNGCFMSCKSLETIQLPETITEIGVHAFYNTGLEHVSIPDSVDCIESSAFALCDKLKNVNLNNVEKVGDSAFFGCSSLERVEHLGKIKQIEEEAFSNCDKLVEFDLSCIENLGKGCFHNCTNLKEVSLLNIKNWYGIEKDKVNLNEKIIYRELSPYFEYLEKSLWSPFYGCTALEIVRIKWPASQNKSINTSEEEFPTLFTNCPSLEIIAFENFTILPNRAEFYNIVQPSHPKKSRDGRAIITSRPEKMTIYGRGEDVKAYAESIGVPFKLLIDVHLNDERIWMDDCLPYIKNDRTMVPMRAIFEALGAEVSWDDATKTAIGVKDGVEIKITIGENVLYKNGEAITLDAVAEITNNRTMVPVRAISEAFGCTVNWNGEMKTVEIDTMGNRTYYVYDESGQVIQTSNQTDYPYHHQYLHDHTGKVVREWQKTAFKNSDRLFEYTYNEKGQRVSKSECKTRHMFDSITDDVPFEEVEKYFYDEEGKLIYAMYPTGEKRYYVYSKEGKLIREENENGKALKKYVYNEDGKVDYTESY